MGLAPDPADAPVTMAARGVQHALDAAADGNFGGKHETVNRRAGYKGVLVHDGQTYTKVEWVLRGARMGGTLNAGEGALLIEHFEDERERLIAHYEAQRQREEAPCGS
jgi:hypothetical protein